MKMKYKVSLLVLLLGIVSALFLNFRNKNLPPSMNRVSNNYYRGTVSWGCSAKKKVAKRLCCSKNLNKKVGCQSSAKVDFFKYEDCTGKVHKIKCRKNSSLPGFNTDGFSENKCKEVEKKYNKNDSCFKYVKRHKGCFDGFNNSESVGISYVKSVLQCSETVNKKSYKGLVSCEALESFYSNGEICDPLGAALNDFQPVGKGNSGLETGSFFDDVVFGDGSISDSRSVNQYFPAPNENRVINYDGPSNLIERGLDKYKKAETMRLEVPGNFIRFFAARLGLMDFFSDLKEKQDSGDPRFTGVKCNPKQLSCSINPIIFGDHLKNFLHSLSDSSEKLDIEVVDHINRSQKKDGIIIKKVSWNTDLLSAILSGVSGEDVGEFNEYLNDINSTGSEPLPTIPNILDIKATWNGMLRVRPADLNRNTNRGVNSDVLSFDLKRKANLFPVPIHFPGGANGYVTNAYNYRDNQKFLDSVKLIPGLTYKECSKIQRLKSHGKYVPWQPWFKCVCGSGGNRTNKNFCIFDPFKRDKNVEIELNEKMNIKYNVTGFGHRITRNRVKHGKKTIKLTLFGGTNQQTINAINVLNKVDDSFTFNHPNYPASNAGLSVSKAKIGANNYNSLNQKLDKYTRDEIDFPKLVFNPDNRQKNIVKKNIEVLCDSSTTRYVYNNKLVLQNQIGNSANSNLDNHFSFLENSSDVLSLVKNFGCAGVNPHLVRFDENIGKPTTTKVRRDFSSSAMAVEANVPIKFGKYDLEFFRYGFGFVPFGALNEFEEVSHRTDYFISGLGGWAGSPNSNGGYGAVSISIQFSAEVEKKFNKNFFSWIIGLVVKTIFKIISAVLSIIANVGFYSVTLLNNNLQMAQFSMEPIDLGAHFMILNKQDSSSAIDVETKVRRIYSSKPVVKINPYKSLRANFPNCSEMRNFSQVSGPRDFIKWFLRSTVGCVFDGFYQVLEFAITPIQNFFTHITDHFFDLNVGLLKSFVSTEIDNAGNSLDEANDVIKIMKHGLETAMFQANLSGSSLENPFYDERGDSNLLSNLERTCTNDPSNKLACITWSILQNRDFGTGINICIERMGAKTHYRSLEDLSQNNIKFTPSFNFPPTRFCHPSYGDTPGRYDREFINRKINQRYLWNFDEIYASTQILKGKYVRLGWRNQCALFTDIKARGLLEMNVSDNIDDGGYQVKAEFIPTERSTYYLNEISVCQDNYRCSPLRKPMKDRLNMAACSLAGDLWFRYDHVKNTADKGVLNFYDIVGAHMNERNNNFLYEFAINGMLQSFCELECDSNNDENDSRNNSCISTCLGDSQEMIDDLYSAYNGCLDLFENKNIMVSKFNYSPDDENSEGSTCD